MLYVGIVGAESPLGKRVVDSLKKTPDMYRIVFCVDESYKVNSPAKNTYASVEAALSFNQSPSVVVDCDDPATAIVRANTYRFYATAAIMCCTCSQDEIDALSCAYVAEEKKAPSLLIVPDYSLRNSTLLSFFFSRIGMHKNNLDRLEITIKHRDVKTVNFDRWMYWANKLNKIAGNNSEDCKIDGLTREIGVVKMHAVEDKSLLSDAETVNVSMYYGDKNRLCRTFMNIDSPDYTANCIVGIKLLLKWFASHRNKIAAGKVFADHLITIVNE